MPAYDYRLKLLASKHNKTQLSPVFLHSAFLFHTWLWKKKKTIIKTRQDNYIKEYRKKMINSWKSDKNTIFL